VAFRVRPARPADLDALVDQFAAVAAEGRWIGSEAPIDREHVRSRYDTRLTEPGHYVSAAELTEPVEAAGPAGTLVGQLDLAVARYGVAELGMSVAASMRGRGVGRALLEDAIAWARSEPGVHKMALQVWPHNEAAQNLYRSTGFVQEGYLTHHYRRRSGEIWDAVVMGLQLG
jgi:RimJ/RimL family protein N-acetyltransferase